MSNRLLLAVILFSISSISYSQLSSSFELRYFSKDKIHKGITDFSGESSPIDSAQRIKFLESYADVASKWFSDSALNTKVNEQEEIASILKSIKPQALPEKRIRLILDSWKSTGINKNTYSKDISSLEYWQAIEGATVKNRNFEIEKTGFRTMYEIDTLNWRFSFSWRALSKSGSAPLSIAFRENNLTVFEAGFHSNGNLFFTEKGRDRMARSYLPGQWYEFKFEVDLINQRYNLYINNQKEGDWIEFKRCSLLNNFQIKASEGIVLDDLKGLRFDTTDQTLRYPYSIEEFINQSFEIPQSLNQWFVEKYDDRYWDIDTLPIVKGGVFEAGQDLYLRKIITPPYSKKAWLNIESLDPGGEIWINGEVRHLAKNKYPVKIDISDYLIPFQKNIIAIRIYSNQDEALMHHSPDDPYTGWFCGRAWIDFTEDICIQDIRVFTESLSPEASQLHHVEIENHTDSSFHGKILIDYYPWFPREGRSIASFEYPLDIYSGDSLHLKLRSTVPNPKLWTHDEPQLYKVHLRITKKGQVIDDYTSTTGFRTVSQEGGTFRINGAPEIIAGVQTMGFRMPIENIVKWNRCAPNSVLIDELLASKKTGNTLRIHVHSGGKYSYSINDPRIAEMADQLGLMLIWPTSAWIREGEWGGIDFAGYPNYMKQVFNHPSIIIWEGSNHPNRFNGKTLDYSNRFISKIYNTIYSTDSSRLVSPSSSNIHFAYRNDEGSIDKNGKKIEACEEWTAPMIVRGNQDALTGYGAVWDKLRSYPDEYRKSMLASNERAYINFEHEESIGMQNFELAKGKPWYKMPSYENRYDIGSVGRNFEYSEWKTSQAWQAFSAWESMKWQRLNDVDGFSWCCLHGGPNSGTYRKPLIDALGHAKLAYYVHTMALQDVLAGSNNTDVALHKSDQIEPVILNVGKEKTVSLKIIIKKESGETIDERRFDNISLPGGRTQTKIPPFKPKFGEEGYYIIEYLVLRS